MSCRTALDKNVNYGRDKNMVIFKGFLKKQKKWQS